MDDETGPDSSSVGSIEWKLLVPDGPLPRRAWVECKIDGLAPIFIVPNVRFGDAYIPPDPIFFSSQIERHMVPVEPLSEDDARIRPRLAAFDKRGLNACLALLTDQRMKEVYEELLKRKPKSFYHEKAQKQPFKDIREYFRYCRECGLSDADARERAKAEIYTFMKPEKWPDLDRCVHQHVAIVSLLQEVLALIVWAPEAQDGAKVKSAAESLAAAKRAKSLVGTLRTAARLMQTPGMHFPRDDLAAVRRIADIAANHAAVLELGATKSPFIVDRLRSDPRTIYFVLHTACLMHKHFGGTIPSVIATLAKVTKIAPTISPSTVEKMVEAARKRVPFPPQYC